MNDRVYKTKREKYKAVIEEIEEMVKEGRPVLVGTTSVEISEMLSKMLAMRKIEHNVLNAKLHRKRGGYCGTGRSEEYRDYCYQHGRSWYRHQAESGSESCGRFGYYRYGTS